MKTFIDVVVGLFFVVGFVALGWLALQLGEVPWLTGSQTYTLMAEFDMQTVKVFVCE